MNRPPDIICFGKDWREPATSNNHIMEELARQGHRVLWVNPLAMRNPNLGSTHDLRKIGRKISGWFRGVLRINNNLRVLSPILFPLPRSRFAQGINRRLVADQVRRETQRWGFHCPQLWIFPPNAVDFVGSFNESVVVYYCTDEWSQFSYLDKEFIRQKEVRLLQQAHIVFVTSQKLLESKSRHHQNVHLIPHGVNYNLFSRAIVPDFPIPADLQAIRQYSLQPSGCEEPRLRSASSPSDSASVLSPQSSGFRSHPSALSSHASPIIGFYGNIYDWVDQELITSMATIRPQWAFVLIGKIMTDVSRLRLPNIHLLGPRPHEELPSYCRGFNVGIIPYKTTDPRIQTVNPLKLREYLAAGVPVVSVDMLESRALSPAVRIASSATEFLRELEWAIANDTPEERQRRSGAMRNETWEARVDQLHTQIESVLASTAR